MATDVAKDTMSTMVKLTREIEELASDVIGVGMVTHSVTYFRDRSWRATLSFLPRPADCRTQVDDVSFEEKVGDMVRSMRLIPKKVSTVAVREGWRRWHRRACLVLAHLERDAARFTVVMCPLGRESIGRNAVQIRRCGEVHWKRRSSQYSSFLRHRFVIGRDCEFECEPHPPLKLVAP